MATASQETHIPLLDLRAQYRSIRDEVREAVERVLESQVFVLGPEVEAFEAEVAAYCEARHAIGVSSGTDALLASLMAAGVTAGDEVVTTPFSFFATAGVIARLGARAVFVDVAPDTLNLDALAAAAAIGPRTKAVIPVHLYGRMAEMDPILAAAREHGCAVIEDAAQAIGARDRQGRPAGSMSDYGCFSFFPSKNLGGFGDGGMITTSDPSRAELLRTLRVHGSRPKYYHRVIGGNFRLDALQAAVLRVKLPHLEPWAEARRRNAATYRRLFAEADLLSRLRLPDDEPGMVYNQFVIRAEARDALREHLAARGVGTEVYYPLPLHRQPCFEAWGYGLGDFPNAEAAAADSLALPIYPELTEDQQAYVVDQIAGFYRGGSAVRA